ncbi:MAG TPA: hypothetical protein VIJ77_06205 [Candidatus Tumulicola sp.]
MRRVVGVIVAGALAAALSFGAASASLVPLPRSTFDLSPSVMSGVFGESTDARASVAAAYGDRTSESPLRDLALQDVTTRREAAFVRDFSAGATFALARGARPAAALDSPFDVAVAPVPYALRASAPFTSPTISSSFDAASAYAITQASPATSFTAGEYRPVAPVPLTSPQPGSFSFGPLVRGGPAVVPASSTLAFGVNGPPAATSTSSLSAPATVRVGPVEFRTRSESAALRVPQLSLNDSGYGAGANFDVRAGARKLNVDLSSNYERLTRNDASSFSSALGTASSWQLPGADAPLVVPNYADMSKVSVGAAVAVPVVNGLTLNLNYGADRMFGGYGMPGLANLDATDNSYGGKLTFEMPHSSSTLSISASQLRYQDNLLPVNTSTQMRENVNFSVKF